MKNLRPIKKGEVRNPKGRPSKMESYASVLKNFIEKQSSIDPNKTNLELLVEATFDFAVEKGNGTALKEMWDRIYGKQEIPLEVNQKITVEQIRKIISHAKVEHTIRE